MSRYDQPGFTGAFPTGPLDAGSLSNAPGSAGIPFGTNAGADLGAAVVSTPFASSQVADNMPVRPVYAGDTSSMSDDLPAHASVIDGTADAGPYMDTGAGHGSVSSPHHPNAGS